MKESLKVSARQASLLGGLTVLFLLLFGLSGIICCVAADARGLTREMQRFAPPADTGLPEEIYPELGRHLSDYLTGKKESFQFLLEDKDGEERELFHDYELVHMADCRNLLQLARMLCICTGLLGAAGLVVLGALDSSVRYRFSLGARNGLRICCAAALLLVGWALFSFDGFFITFHRLAFRNDLWLLNPRTDLLIRLMPENLFIDLGLRGLLAAGVWVLLLTVGFARIRQKNAG